ncbi:DUF1737 domain-containing protein [Flavobacterium beibuense]|uniref:DUF1737 domain-containing protein n=1 Tax=Flavobacterium beibuense TaxID=657326 RepID=UPI003A91CA6F
MTKVRNYEILSAKSAGSLEMKIKSRLSQSWELYGNLVVLPNGELAQAMVIY